MKMDLDCLTLGEPLICFDSMGEPLDSTTTVRKYVAGAESNLAIGLARLGRSVGYIGRVGADSCGREIVRTLRGEGVDVTGLTATEAAPTAILLKERLGSGRTEVTYHRAASAGSTLDVSDLPVAFDGIRRLHVSGITLVLSSSASDATLAAMRRARAAGARVSLDANFRLKLAPVSVLVEQFERAATLADEVLIGRAEAALCAGSDDDAAVEDYARSLAVDIAVLKGRGGGATAFSADGRVDVPAKPVDVVDPVGAGDAFAVGFLHAMLEGAALPDALERGGAVAARVIARHGDYHGLPYSDEFSPTAQLELAVRR
jgi:2-dehydro-3-deoxygluconokinase